MQVLRKAYLPEKKLFFDDFNLNRSVLQKVIFTNEIGQALIIPHNVIVKSISPQRTVTVHITNQVRVIQRKRHYFGGDNYPNSENTMMIIYFIIGLNILFFFIVATNNDAGLNSIVRNHFTVTVQNLKKGHIWTLLTSSIHHTGLFEMLFDMFTLFFVGRTLANVIPSTFFLALYLGGGLTSNLTFATINWAESMSRIDKNFVPESGSRGSLFSVLAFFACLYPRETINLYGIIPVKVAHAVVAFFILDQLFEFQAKWHADPSHLFAGLFGMGGYYLALRRGRFY